MRDHAISEVMTEEVVRAHPGTPFKEVAEVLGRHRINGLPVVDDEDRVLGVISESDLILHQAAWRTPRSGRLRLPVRGRAAREAQRKARARTAEQLMTRPAITVGPRDDIATAARTMVRHGVERLPVVDDNGRLAGIVTRRDLLKVFLRPDREIHREVVDAVFVRALWLSPSTVEVSVDDGVVTLRGQLERRSEIPLAVRMAGEVSGVVAVVSHLTFRVDDFRQAPDGRVLGDLP